MKPFNLEKALAGAPLVTRDGKEVRLFTKGGDLTTYNYPYSAFIPSKGIIETYTPEGRYYRRNIRDSSFDLFMAGDTFSEEDTPICKLEVLERLYKIAVDGGAVSQSAHILEEIEAILYRM